MTTMDDLIDGVRVCWPASGTTGTITVEGRRTWVRWDTEPGRFRVSERGQVCPADLVIIGRSS